MATGLKAKTFTLTNLQATGSGAVTTTIYTCPADKYAEIIVAYLAGTSVGPALLAYRAIPSGFAAADQLAAASGTGQTRNFQRPDGTLFTTDTGGASTDEGAIRLHPGDKLELVNTSGNYEYRVIVEEISAF